MYLTDETTDLLKSATTPEEAYKIFAEAFSNGLGGLIANSIAQAININSANISLNNPNIIGWEKYLTGLVFNASFGPGYKVQPTTKNTFSQSQVTSSTFSGGGLTVTVGGTWNF